MPLRKPLALESANASMTAPSMTAWSSILALSAKPERCNLCYVDNDVAIVIFDFDGTLTGTPGEHATRKGKVEEMRERKAMLEPQLRRLRDEGIVLGIMSKSTEATVLGALEEVGMRELFTGPTVFKALGLGGKAGIITDMACEGKFASLGLGEEDLCRILLVDDDVYELERARDRGIQTFAAPENGGLQEEDFVALFVGMGLEETPESLKDLVAQRVPPTIEEEEEEPQFPRDERVIRVWTAGLCGVSLGLDSSKTQHVDNITGIGPLYKDLYEVEKTIGKGGFSLIASGRHIASGKQVALKAVRKKDAGPFYYKNFVTDDTCDFILRMTTLAPHPNIINYFDYLEGDIFLFGTMEILSGQDLSAFLQEQSPITTDMSQRLTCEALSALAHFHSVLNVGLIHRDVKLENLQFRQKSETSELVLVDVGLCCPASPQVERTVVGTLLYTAPEMFTLNYTSQVDMWSLGVVSYIMLTGTPPWIQDRRTFRDRKVIDDGHVQRALETPQVKRLPEVASDFLRKVLVLDPEVRLSAATALEHPWISPTSTSEEQGRKKKQQHDWAKSWMCWLTCYDEPEVIGS